MAVTQKVTLYNNKFTVPPVINAVQNDTDRQVEAYFGDFTLQVGMTGVLSFIRSDRTHYEVSATLNTGANTATAELDQALTQAGVTQAQLKITDSGNVGSTFTFMIKVQPDVAGLSQQQDGYSVEEIVQRLTDAEDAIEDVEDDVADLQGKEYDYAPVITDTASGAIATFVDGADGYPMRSVVAEINPVQDLHGQANPYPAGGGKNKLQNNIQSQEKNGITITVADDGSMDLNGTCSGWFFLNLNYKANTLTIPTGSYVANGGVAGLALSIYVDGAKITTTFFTSDTSFTVSAGATSSYARIEVSAGVSFNHAKVFPMIRLASVSDDTFAPYENLCPISGFSQANIAVTGINVWDEQWEVGGINSSTGAKDTATNRIRTKNKVKVKPNTQYIVISPSNNVGGIYFYASDDTYLGLIYTTPQLVNGVFTTPTNADYLYFTLPTGYGTTYNNDCGINYPATETAYVPYNPQSTTHTIPLGRTVYVGTVNVTTGKLTVTHGQVTFNDLTWTIETQSDKNYFRSSGISDAKDVITYAGTMGLLCSAYPCGSQSEVDNMTVGLFMRNKLIGIKDGSFATASDFETAMGSQTLVYELATPVEYDLTETEIKSLLGDNNVWTDTNGNITVAYCADTRKFIEKLLNA